MKDHDPVPSNFLEISRGELQSLFQAFADNLVQGGKVEVNAHAVLKDLDETPHSFSQEIPTIIAKKVFYPNETEIAPTEARIQYDQKHRIDDAQSDDFITGVYVFIRSRLIDKDVYVDQVFRISQDDQFGPDFTADVEVQRTDSSGKKLDFSVIDETDSQEEKIKQAFKNVNRGVRRLTLEDVEMLRGLIDFLNGTMGAGHH